MCVGGSDRRIGCSWPQFFENLEEALYFVTNAIGDSYVTPEEANFFVKTPTVCNGRPVNFIKPSTMQDVNIVKIQNFSETKTGCCKPYDIKVLLVELCFFVGVRDNDDPQAEILNLLEFENIIVPINYNRCKPVCNFCRESGHWKSDYSKFLKKKKVKIQPFLQPKTAKTAKKSSKNKGEKDELRQTKIMQK
ncbi:hypothetical protein BB561_006369 [Smittium simulii]|uniref:Uncharacterized protein n=1 Tax=Smittium simulii TaxID=133385 RepID=A0A2T9Y4V6_9FUNG|nr:hypothetical protein BB561_006369 [Smittium simulii]